MMDFPVILEAVMLIGVHMIKIPVLLIAHLLHQDVRQGHGLEMAVQIIAVVTTELKIIVQEVILLAQAVHITAMVIVIQILADAVVEHGPQTVENITAAVMMVVVMIIVPADILHA